MSYSDSALGGNASSGINSHIVAREEAELGSRELNARVQGLFHSFAAKHRIAPEEARILLLDTGVKL